MKNWYLSSLIILAAVGLAGCGIKAASPTAHHTFRKKVSVSRKAPVKPAIRWTPVSVGSEVLLNEGTSISSIVPGPNGRIYYGTGNPLGDAASIGWINLKTQNNHVSNVPTVSPQFPQGAKVMASNVTQSSYWGQVDLVVSGSHTIWYRHWGYIGGWTVAGKFVPGTYAIPEPTVHRSHITASLRMTFTGQQSLRIFNTQSRQLQSFQAAFHQMPLGISLNPQAQQVWVLTSNAIWRFNIRTNSWRQIALASTGFYVAMGQWKNTIWVVNSSGRIGTITANDKIMWLGSSHTTPLTAIGTQHSIWIAGLHHLTRWNPKQSLQQWTWPKLQYPNPAQTWAVNGTKAPPNWPPLPHLSAGPMHGVLIGYGTLIGEIHTSS